MNARVFLATHGGGVARAVRHGSDWSVQRCLESLDVRCLATDPSRPDTVYAGTQHNGLRRSDDAGDTWRATGLKDATVKAVAVSPHDPDTVYAGLKPAGIAVSRDGGGSWEELDGFKRIRGRRLWFSPAEAPGTAYVQGLGVSPGDPDLIVAGMEFGAVVRSEDGGRTWSGHRKGAIRDCHNLCFHATDGGRVYEGGAGFPKAPGATSRDGGRTWEKARGGEIDRGYGWACAADPGDPDTWYVSASTGPRHAHGDRDARAFIYRSRGGGPFKRLAGGLPQPLDAMPYALLTDPGAPGHLYAGLASGQVWFTADYGESWTRLDVELGGVHRSTVVLVG